MLNQQMLSEVACGVLVTVQTLAAGVLLAVLPPDRTELILWTLLPMIGATLAASGAFCFNTASEVRKIVVGRCLFALVIGIIGPRILSMVHPWLRDIMIDPLLLVGAGFVHGFLGYLLSWPFVRRAYERAPAVAARQVAALEAKMAAEIGEDAKPKS